MAYTKAQLQDHVRKFGRYTVRVKRRGSWDRTLDGVGGRFKTREEAEARIPDVERQTQCPCRVREEDDGL
jgi:hypothetical protein